MVRIDPAVDEHQQWIDYVRPTGLVVSPHALARANAILDRRDAEGQRLLQATAEQRTFAGEPDPVDWIPDFRTFAEKVLGWGFSPKAYAGTAEAPIPDELEVALPDYDEVLRPDFAVRELDPAEGASSWQLLVRVLEPGQGFDSIVRGNGHLEATATTRMERLLRETRAPAGLLFDGRALRLMSAPRGESSGWLDFKVTEMLQTAGRPICTALRLLLSEQRLLSLPRSQRLAALLDASRKFQNEVSEKLAEQVLHALYELLRGFQAAHDASSGVLLRDPLQDDPDEVYRAWLTVILRLVFLLYAEERDMLPDDSTYTQHYSLGGLYERLREDAALFPDTMDQRFGAWAQLLVLFRVVFDGADTLGLPQRHGALFDPDRFPFLEGRPSVGGRQINERIQVPLVPDGTIYRVLEDLLVLDGERISYRALDVEQIGSVYETMMGFRLETAGGTSVAVKAQKRHGAPTALDLEALSAQTPKTRAKWIQDRADRKVPAKVAAAVVAASTIEDLHAALEPVIDKAATPDLVPKGAMVLQPSEERRRSGSHYTPRSLTEPIVRTTLEPILARLRSGDGPAPTPGQILELKVCDPAMGSGAFLVEACRQLGEALIESWHAHDRVPVIPPDEDEVIYARRLVAQRCLYGVDRNPVAVDLAKVSLWLATLARSHALTFVDHALRHGDSLIGLSRRQIEAFHWEGASPAFEAGFEAMRVREHVAKVASLRARIRDAGEETADWELRDLWDQTRLELDQVRLFGDLLLAAFFGGQSAKERESKRYRYAQAVAGGDAEQYRGMLEDWRGADPPLAPFHWQIEFPEVWERERPGFDAMLGNPPFMGGHKVWPVLGGAYRDYLKVQHEESGGKAVDLVAHFFRRCYSHAREEGTVGLIATNTIAQGDTRIAGLRYLCRNGATVYSATRRLKWPGSAAVVVSVVHLIKGRHTPILLDGKEVDGLNSFLFPSRAEFDPQPLRQNAGLSYRGSMVYGMGFTFDDSSESGSPLELMRALTTGNPHNRERIFMFVGGEELNSSPMHDSERFIINFEDMPLTQAEEWPDLTAIVREKVKPERDALGGYGVADRRREYWWQYGTFAASLNVSLRDLPRCLALSQVTQHLALCFQPTNRVFSHAAIVFPIAAFSAFAALQSRAHEVWARFFGSSLEDRLRYTPSDCFETFPFPEEWVKHRALESAGEAYYSFRADLMVRNDEGLTKTYNRFHDPNERDPAIVKLRELHSEMDRAVLDAYGFTTIPTDCDFFMDHQTDDDDAGARKKPWRHRWPDEVRDEVLARLLALNAARAQDEARAGKAAGSGKRARKAKTALQREELF